jgi:hypothetical protein
LPLSALQATTLTAVSPAAPRSAASVCERLMPPECLSSGSPRAARAAGQGCCGQSPAEPERRAAARGPGNCPVQVAALWPAPKDAALVQVATGSLAVCVEWSTTRELAAGAQPKTRSPVWLLAVARRHREPTASITPLPPQESVYPPKTTEVIRDQPLPWGNARSTSRAVRVAHKGRKGGPSSA